MEPRELSEEGAAGNQTLQLERVREPEVLGGMEASGGIMNASSQSRPRRTSSMPFMAIVLGLLAAFGFGIALFIASRFIYIYILYNSIVGAGIGAAIGVGYERAHRRRFEVKASLLLVMLCCLAAYWSFNFVWMFLAGEQIPLSTSSKGFPRLLAFLAWRAQAEDLFGAKLGPTVNYLIWAVEYAITMAAAWQKVTEKVLLLNAQALPFDVEDSSVFMAEERKKKFGVLRALGLIAGILLMCFGFLALVFSLWGIASGDSGTLLSDDIFATVFLGLIPFALGLMLSIATGRGRSTVKG